MNEAMIPTIVITIFLTFVILGFVCGWFRGLSKSLIRFIMVLAVGVFSFFVIPPITKAVLTMDVSKLNIVIGEVQAITVGDLITDLLRQIPIIEELIESSSTFESFLQLLPEMLVNVILFVVMFFLIKWLSLIVYWIIAAIFFSKKKREGKEKHGFIGAIVGALQGVVVACVVFVPIFGLVETAKPVMTALQQTSDGGSQSQTFVADEFYAQPEDDVEKKSPIAIDAKIIEGYIEAFEDNWVYKMLDTVGIKKLSVSMFDELSTVDNNKIEVSFRKEVKILSGVYPEISVIIDKNFNIQDSQTIMSFKNIVNKLYESEVLSGVVNEIIPSVAERWNVGEKFCGIAKPQIENASIQAVLDSLLLNLEVSSGDTIKQDINSSLNVLIIVNNAELLKTISSDGDVMDVLTKEGNEELISDIIGAALESQSLKAVLPKIINVGMNYVYDALGIDSSNINDITIESSEVEDWGAEKLKLQTIFTNVVTIYDQIKSGESEGMDPLECLDFAALGATLDNMKNSELLGDASGDIMKALLTSPDVVGTNNELQPFMEKIEDLWDEDVSMESTFASIGDAVKLARDLKVVNTNNITAENVENILTGLTNNTDLKEAVLDIVTTDTLEGMGLDGQTAGVVNEIITSVVRESYSEEKPLENEINAVTEVFGVANKVMVLEEGDQADITDSAESLVNALAESNVLLETISKSESDVSTMISGKITEESLSAIEEAIGKIQDQQKKEQLLALFGL